MASSTPTTHSVLTTTAHSIAQVLPAEIIEQIHKSLCAVEEDVHVGGFTRRGRRFAGVCSAWRNEALRRGEYVVNSLGQFENFVGFMEGDAASAKRAVGLNVRARFRNNADKIKRSALVKRLAALCVELSSLTLFVGEDTGSSMIRSENQPFVDGDVRTELAKLRRMKDFWMRGGKITLEQVRLLIASWPDLRRLNRPEIRFDSDHAVVAAQISQIPQSRLTTLIIDIDPPHSYSLISRLASGNTITELNLGLAYFPTKGQDDFIAVLTRLAPQLVTLDLEEHRSPSPDLLKESILPALEELELMFINWDAKDTLVPFFQGRSKPLRKLTMLFAIPDALRMDSDEYDMGDEDVAEAFWEAKNEAEEEIMAANSYLISVGKSCAERFFADAGRDDKCFYELE